MPVIYECDICGQRIPTSAETKIFKVKVIIGSGILHDFEMHDSDTEKEFGMVCGSCKENFIYPSNPYSHRD